MTLVYAQKLEDGILIVSDTYSEVPMTQERANPFVNPLIKIALPMEGVVVAYAGTSARAEAAFENLHANGFDQMLRNLRSQSELQM